MACASDQEIQQAFDDLGVLWAAEHSYHDDKGAGLVAKAMSTLRQYKAWEYSPQHEEYINAQATQQPQGKPVTRPRKPRKPAGGPPYDMGTYSMAPSGVSPSETPTQALEATYDLSDGRSVLYDDGPLGRQLAGDVADLYTVISELYGTGSPNLENQQAKDLLGLAQQGGGFGDADLGTYRRLMRKHKPKIDALRRKRDLDGQDPWNRDSEGPDSRILDPDSPELTLHARP